MDTYCVKQFNKINIITSAKLVFYTYILYMFKFIRYKKEES